MEKPLCQMLENYLSSTHGKLQRNSHSLDFTIQSTKGSMYNILPYLYLIYFDIHTQSLPGDFSEATSPQPLHFDYCVEGRIELFLDDNSCIYLKENDFSISRMTSQNESYFPMKYYHGITLYFDPDFFGEANRNIAELFEFNLAQLQKIYFEKKDPYIGEANDEIRNILNCLWQCYETPSPFYMKLCVLELLHLLLNKQNVCPEKKLTFYTSVQVEIAKKAEQLLTADLKQHIPIKQLAQQFGVSETSLKNYFRGVYGKNVSKYLRDLRMSTAERLLTETKLPVSEIAAQVGYTKQGKFAEVFRQCFQMNPLEYRRTEKLKKL